MPALMQSASVIRIEKTLDWAASALFALACGYAGDRWFAAELHEPAPGVAVVAASALALFLCNRALNAVKPHSQRLPVPIFDVREVEPMEHEPPQAELLLTDRVDVGSPSEEEPLLLDDILAELGSNSRVVRLFDPAAMPTAGELRSRIDQHLDSDISEAQSNDAAQALHDALAELRRSLR